MGVCVVVCWMVVCVYVFVCLSVGVRVGYTMFVQKSSVGRSAPAPTDRPSSDRGLLYIVLIVHIYLGFTRFTFCPSAIHVHVFTRAPRQFTHDSRPFHLFTLPKKGKKWSSKRGLVKNRQNFALSKAKIAASRSL